MAKQRGIHQIKGKINNLCYYEQKYVRGGLIRRINEAMSERLKTDEVFVNTRLANSFFGAFSILAKTILSFASWRYVTLTIPSRQALLTKLLKKIYEMNVGRGYGIDISVAELVDVALLSALDSIAKVKISHYFPSIPRTWVGAVTTGRYSLVIPQSELNNYADTFNIRRVQIEFLGFSGMDDILYDSTTKKYYLSSVNTARVIKTYTWARGNVDLTISLDVYDPGMSICLGYLVILPVYEGSGATAKFYKSGAIGAFIYGS